MIAQAISVLKTGYKKNPDYKSNRDLYNYILLRKGILILDNDFFTDFRIVFSNQFDNINSITQVGS